MNGAHEDSRMNHAWLGCNGMHSAHPHNDKGGGTHAWAMVWEAGVMAAAAAAAKSNSRGKLGQWQDIRRKARGGSVLPMTEMEALGVQYSSLENDFEVRHTWFS